MTTWINPTLGVDGPSLLDWGAAGRRYRFRLLHVGEEVFAADPARHARPGGSHRHDVYHAVLYGDGRGRYALDQPEAVRCAEPGTLVLTAPGMPHRFGAFGPDAFRYAEITFALVADGEALTASWSDLLARWTGLPCLAVEQLRLPSPLDTRLYRRLTAIARRIGVWDPPQRARVHCALADFFRELARFLGLSRTPDRVAAERGGVGTGGAALEAARREIHRRFRERILVAELARIAHLSPSQFSRRFRAAYGAPPVAYQLALRVEAARTLLTTSDLSCKEIAARLGFQDGFHFSKCFKQHAGIPPTAFRRRLHG